MNGCVFLLFLPIAGAQILYQLYDFNAEQQAQIIQEHNRLRRLEPAANMQEMVWDSRLASMARSHVSTCNAWHSSTGFRTNNGGYSFVGENIWWSTENYLRNDLKRIIRDFYNEKPYFHFGSVWCQPGQMCGHYTAVVWGDTCAVGCAAAYCNGIRNGRGIVHGHVYICNYGPGGNKVGYQPYLLGAQCSKCPAGARCNNGLCEPQCRGHRYGESQSIPRPFPPRAPVAQTPRPSRRPKPTKSPQQLSIRGQPCADYHPECGKWQRRGECSNNPDYMLSMCLKACDACDHKPSATTRSPKTTTNRRTRRPAAATKQPQRPQTTRKPSKSTTTCVDRHHLCPFWAGIGECSANIAYMETECYRACHAGTCGSEPNFRVPGYECADLETSCNFWAGIGECRRNKHFMEWRCRRACQTC